MSTQHELSILHTMRIPCTFYISSHDSKTGGLDYHEPIADSSGSDTLTMSCSYSLTVSIPAGDDVANGVVTIADDTIYEGEEEFFLDLSVAPTLQEVGINEGSLLRTTVEIQDDDGEIALYPSL